MSYENWAPTYAALLQTIEPEWPVYYAHELQQLDDVALPAVLLPPCWLFHLEEGTQEYSQGGPALTLHYFPTWLVAPTPIIAEAASFLTPYIARLRAKLAGAAALGSLTWTGGRVHTILPVPPPERWYQGPREFEYAGQKYMGVRFNNVLKESDTITVAP